MTLGNEVVDKIHIDNGEKKEKREKKIWQFLAERS